MMMVTLMIIIWMTKRSNKILNEVLIWRTTFRTHWLTKQRKMTRRSEKRCLKTSSHLHATISRDKTKKTLRLLTQHSIKTAWKAWLLKANECPQPSPWRQWLTSKTTAKTNTIQPMCHTRPTLCPKPTLLHHLFVPNLRTGPIRHFLTIIQLTRLPLKIKRN